MSLPVAISRLASYSLSLQVSCADLRFKVCGFWCPTRGEEPPKKQVCARCGESSIHSFFDREIHTTLPLAIPNSAILMSLEGP